MFSSVMTVDSESDDDILMEPALGTLEDGGGEFDLNIPPTTGSEYIRRVRREAKDCPGIVVAKLDTSVFKHKQTVKVSEGSGCLSAPKSFIPSIKWQKAQVTYFAEVRQKLARYKETMRKNSKYSQKLPGANDAEGWCRLCFGRIKLKRQSQQVISIQDKEDCDEDSQTESEKTEPNEREPTTEQVGGVPPLLSIIAAMDQPRVVNVLEYHLNWFQVTGLSPHQHLLGQTPCDDISATVEKSLPQVAEQFIIISKVKLSEGQWFYALLLSLQKPLTPEACSLLRSLSRDCANYRAKLKSPDDPDITPLNVLICLVGRYFGQTDLADNE